MPRQLRRVVTGLDPQGRSTIVIDGAPGASFAVSSARLDDFWVQPGPAMDRRDHEDQLDGQVVLSPPPTGSRFRFFELWPAPADSQAQEVEAAKAFSGIQADAARKDTSRHAGMHETKTIDYIILLRGRARLILEAGEVELEPFDTVVQRGTNHAWEALGDEPALFCAVLIDAAFTDGDTGSQGAS